MTQEWTIEGPRRLDIGDEGQRVTAAQIKVVAGTVDLVTHDDDGSAHLEVRALDGTPLRVRWDGSRLEVVHESLTGSGVLDSLRHLGRGGGISTRHRVELTLSLPVDATVSLSTVSATVLCSGQQAPVRIRTVSGDAVLTGIRAPMVLDTVSGDADGDDLRGDLRVNTVSGDVTVRSSALPHLAVATTSGNLTFDLSDGRCAVSTKSVSGDVTLRVPTGSGYAVRSRSVSGTVLVDGELVGGRRAGGGPGGGSATRSSGDQGLQIDATSVSGDVVVLTGPAAGPDAQVAG